MKRILFLCAVALFMQASAYAYSFAAVNSDGTLSTSWKGKHTPMQWALGRRGSRRL